MERCDQTAVFAGSPTCDLKAAAAQLFGVSAHCGDFSDVTFVCWSSSVFYFRPWCKIVPCFYGLTTLEAGGSPVFYLSAITEGRWN